MKEIKKRIKKLWDDVILKLRQQWQHASNIRKFREELDLKFLESILYALPTKVNLTKENNRRHRLTLKIAHRESDWLAGELAVDEDNIVTVILAKAYWGVALDDSEQHVVDRILKAEALRDQIFYHYLDLDVLTKSDFFTKLHLPAARAKFLDSLKKKIDLTVFKNGREPIDYSLDALLKRAIEIAKRKTEAKEEI